MKRPINDIESWRLQQSNKTKPFSYHFPQMPPHFRCCRVFTRALFVLEWGCFGAFIAKSSILGILFVFIGKENVFSVLQEKHLFPLFSVFLFLFLSLSVLFRLLRHTPKFFWHCPCCGLRFPYYAPAHYQDILKENDSLEMIRQLHIQYLKLKFCPLIFPSICPRCKKKFFDIKEKKDR